MTPAETDDHSGRRRLTSDSTESEGKTGRGGGCEVKRDTRKPPNKALPPCRVCDSPGAGLHYGVNTCDPCKAFFRRTLTGTKALKCSSLEGELGKCPISKTNKNLCSYCRLKKCEAVGMSKSAIRLGRYTLAKKTKDTIEIKAGHNNGQEDKVGQLEDFINSVMAAHKSTLEYMYDKPGYENIEEMKKQVTDQLLKEPVQNAPLDSQSFLHLYRQGIEPDCRVKNIKDWGEYMSMTCKQFVCFLQLIPGFVNLPHEDKICLAKSAFIETDMMSHANLCCEQVSVVFIPHNGTYRPMFCDNIFGKELAHQAMKIAIKMKRLKMTNEELCLLKILNIFATDRACFTDTKSIESIRQLSLDSLNHVMRHISDTERNLRFSKIIDILQYSSFVAHQFERFFQNVLIQYVDLDPLTTTPEITKEMLGLLNPRDPSLQYQS